MLTWLSKPIYRSIIWQIIGFFGMFFMREFGVNHIDWPIILMTYFTLVVGCMLATNPDILAYLEAALSRHYWLILLFFLYLLLIFIYAQLSPSEKILSTYKDVHFAYLSHVYILTKSADILFQQLAFAMFVLDLSRKGLPARKIQYITAALLTVTHLATLYTLPYVVSIFFVVGGCLGGLVFPLLILDKRCGLIPAYIVHWLYYLSAGLLFNLSLGTL